MVRDLAATLAALAAFIYVTGGAALMARLGLIRLPSSTAVPQLPREFLISNGLLIVSPAIVAGALAYWVARRPVKAEGQTGFWRRPVKSEGPTRLARLRSGLVEPLRRHPTRVGVVVGGACYLVVGVLVVAKDPFPACVYLTGGRTVAGVFIGEANNRTYLGGQATDHPRRIISIPESQVSAVFIGGHDLRGTSCAAR